jgi:hypothetical protein
LPGTGSPKPFRAIARNVALEPPKQEKLEPSGKFSVEYDSTNDSLVLKTTAAGGTPSSLSLSANEVDQLMRSLADLRPRLSNFVPNDPVAGEQFLAQYNPRWELRRVTHREAPGFQLFLRHQGYGWQAYFFPQEEAAAIAKLISAANENETKTEHPE